MACLCRGNNSFIISWFFKKKLSVCLFTLPVRNSNSDFESNEFKMADFRCGKQSNFLFIYFLVNGKIVRLLLVHAQDQKKYIFKNFLNKLGALSKREILTLIFCIFPFHHAIQVIHIQMIPYLILKISKILYLKIIVFIF